MRNFKFCVFLDMSALVVFLIFVILLHIAMLENLQGINQHYIYQYVELKLCSACWFSVLILTR
jgi:hypothetical protein